MTWLVFGVTTTVLEPQMEGSDQRLFGSVWEDVFVFFLFAASFPQHGGLRLFGLIDQHDFALDQLFSSLFQIYDLQTIFFQIPATSKAAIAERSLLPRGLPATGHADETDETKRDENVVSISFGNGCIVEWDPQQNCMGTPSTSCSHLFS